MPEEWVIEPIVPKGRQVAVYSPPKDGKSLFALDSSAAAAADGRSSANRRDLLVPSSTWTSR